MVDPSRRPRRSRSSSTGSARRQGFRGSSPVIEYASGSRPVAREHLDVVGFLRRLDWVLLLAVGAAVGYGLWAVAGITRFDVEGDESYYVVRQAVAAGIGLVRLLLALAIHPHRYRPPQGPI